jgi:phosphate transport system ATP-binding protein
MADPILRVENFAVRFGGKALIEGVNCSINAREVFGLIGPSGSGKSTFLRSLNRLAECTPGLRVSGQVYFCGQPIYAPRVDVDALRERIGIIFQQPVVFPRSILANVIFGIRHLGRISRRDWPDAAEQALRDAALWDEVKDRLKSPALRLSVGQQQRLCLARALAVNPEVILMDEPTSALDAASAEAIESLILRLKQRHAIVLVTHNLGQAHRVCDRMARMTLVNDVGRLQAITQDGK